MNRIIAALGIALLLTLTACSNGTETAANASAPAAATWNVITPQQLHQMMNTEDVYLVNVHIPYEGEIPGTDAFIPYTEIASRLGELPFGKQQVVIYCRSGNMSTEAAQQMVAAGAPQFSELGGGFYAWQDAGYPLKQS